VNQADAARAGAVRVSNIAPDWRRRGFEPRKASGFEARKTAEILCGERAFLVEYRLFDAKVFFIKFNEL